MSKLDSPKTVLAIDPTVRGFGYAVFEGQRNPIDWGVLSVRINKNYRCRLKAKELIEFYQPDVVVLEDVKKSLRTSRIKDLIVSLTQLCKALGVDTKLYHRSEILRVFGKFGKSTKFEIAQTICEWLPEFSTRLPEKRKNCDTEAPGYGIFDAAALAIVHMYLSE